MQKRKKKIKKSPQVHFRPRNEAGLKHFSSFSDPFLRKVIDGGASGYFVLVFHLKLV